MSSPMYTTVTINGTTHNLSAPSEESVVVPTTSQVGSSAASTISSLDFDNTSDDDASISSAATCDTEDDLPALNKEDLSARDSLEIARSSIARKQERRNTLELEDSLPVLTAEDLPARDSLEIVRKTIAHKRERRNANAAVSAGLSFAVGPADVMVAEDTTFGSRLTRCNTGGPWDYYIPHRNSIDLPRERAVLDVVANRRSFVQRVGGRVRAAFGAALAHARPGRSFNGSAPINERPVIEVLQHTMRKLA